MKIINCAALAIFTAVAVSPLAVRENALRAAPGGLSMDRRTDSHRTINPSASSHCRKARSRNYARLRCLDRAVWKAWTDPDYIRRWWGPKGFTSPSCKIDFRVGGKFLFCMRAPKEFQGGQDFYTAGVYTKIVPLRRIEFTQGLSDKDGNRIDPSTMGMPPDFPNEIPSALAFNRVGNKTELTATEYGWTVGQMRNMSESGLNECLDKLAAVLQNQK